MHASFVLALALLLQPGPDEPLGEERLIAIERRVEAIQKEFRDNQLLLEREFAGAIGQAERREDRVVEIFARVVRVDEDRVHVRFFRELGDGRGPLVEFVDKRGGEFVGGTKNQALVIGPTAVERPLALTLRRDDLLRIRGRLVSIDLAAREEPGEPPRTTPERSVKVVIASPEVKRVEAAPARPARPVVPAPVVPPPIVPPPVPPGPLPPPPGPVPPPAPLPPPPLPR